MSTDYSKMSDFEINWKVAFHIGLRTVEKAESGDFNPCNNPADAWPIIADNGISLECIIVNRHEKTWRSQFKTAYVKHRVNHKNPLRAAMIVFLLMQESKNAS